MEPHLSFEIIKKEVFLWRRILAPLHRFFDNADFIFSLEVELLFLEHEF